MWFLALWAIGVISGIIHISVAGLSFTKEIVSSTLLLHQFVVTSGLVAIIGIHSHMIIADKMAKSLGWPGGPFQTKYAFAQFTLLVIGIPAIFYRGTYWIGALIINYMNIITGSFTVASEMIRNKKTNPNSIARLIMAAVYFAFLTVLSVYAKIW